jgi:amidohydrolase
MPHTELQKIRKELHRNPELSGYEVNTARIIAEYLTPLKADELLTNVGGHGVVCTFNGHQPGPHILLRCDMDALPIQEVNTFDHKSTKENVSHKCGHDGHTSILLGVANFLSQNKPKKGQVTLLFQPAEETGKGAIGVINDKQFRKIKPDYVFALHNLPGYEMHQIILKEDVFNASVTTMIIKLQGKTAHAAEPEHGINPSFAIADIIQEFNTYMVNDPKRDDFVVITPVYTKIGALAYGTAAGTGESHFTIRCWSQQQMNQLKSKLIQKCESTCQRYKLTSNISWEEDFQSNQNDSEAIQIIRDVAKNLDYNCLEKEEAFKWGEDFGVFTQKFKGAMFGLGAGINTPALHNPDYDFPDDLIESGIHIFTSIINKTLENNV